MRALLAQLDPRPGDVDANAAAIAAAVAAHPEAELAAFPELFLTGYDAARAAQLALAPGDAPLPTLQSVARRHGTALVFGFAERVGDAGAVANSVACIDADGRWVATYRKTHLFGAGERAVFAAGEELRVVSLAGHRIGPLICYDVEFPEPARALARAGAELLLTVAANMAPYGPDHALAARARALDNRLPHLYVNRIGDEAGLHFVGGSAAIDPGGRPLQELGDEERLLLVELPPGRDRSTDDVDYLEHLRGDLVVAAAPPTDPEGEIR